MDVTYKVRRTNGKLKLNYFSSIPVQPNFIPPANVAVVHYGRPAAPIAPAQTIVQPGGVTQQTTTTRTTTVGTPGVSMNVSPLNMNITINDPLDNTTHTTTTTTTTYSSSNNVVTNAPPQPVGCINAYPMATNNFNSAMSSIRSTSFSDSQLKTAKQVATSNCLSTSQIVQICRIFSFEETKLDFAKFAYDHCTDPNNYFKVNEVFSFSSSSDDLNNYITGH